jgi:hypothetical protein
MAAILARCKPTLGIAIYRTPRDTLRWRRIASKVSGTTKTGAGPLIEASCPGDTATLAGLVKSKAIVQRVAPWTATEIADAFHRFEAAPAYRRA